MPRTLKQLNARPAAAKSPLQVVRQIHVQNELQDRIVEALRHKGFLNLPEARKAAFHLADWLEDLVALHSLFTKRGKWDNSSAQEVLEKFAVHDPAHMAAAHRIIVGAPLTDVFELGAVKGTGRTRRSAAADRGSKRRKA